MVVRKKLKIKDKTKKFGLYFIEEKSHYDFIPTGCTVLDLTLGGGWVLRRVSNLSGEKASGKTHVAIEAVSNFYIRYAYLKGEVHYIDAEQAFVIMYAEALGIPENKVKPITSIVTIEGLFKYLDAKVFREAKIPKLVIVDSLDALDTDEDTREDLNEPGYSAMRKAGKLSECLRKRMKEIEQYNVHLMIISQVRANAGVSFGRKVKKGGGYALEHYLAQSMFFKAKAKMKRKVMGQERVYGVHVTAINDKNKIGLPFRECDYPILFSYGIDNVYANLKFLVDTKKIDELSFDVFLSKKKKKLTIKNKSNVLDRKKEDDKSVSKDLELLKAANDIRNTGDVARLDELDNLVREVWKEIETDFLPTKGKYK